jgi:hypothetical protein
VAYFFSNLNGFFNGITYGTNALMIYFKHKTISKSFDTLSEILDAKSVDEDEDVEGSINSHKK